MVQGVPPHAHCAICGIPIEVGERRCGSADCEAKHAEAQRMKKRSVWMLVGIIFLVTFLSLLGKLR